MIRCCHNLDTSTLKILAKNITSDRKLNVACACRRQVEAVQGAMRLEFNALPSQSGHPNPNPKP